MINAIKIPKITILIPVFNREKYIAECIESALNQTYENYEIVIVDNASTDTTATICKDFAIKNSKIRFFENHENIGPVKNWQSCAREARGELSKILFSDDLLLPNCLEEMVAHMNDRVGLVYSAALIGESMNRAAVRYSLRKSGLQAKIEFINAVINGDAPVSPGAILLRSDDLRRNLHATFPTSTPQQFHMHGAGPDILLSFLSLKNYSSVYGIAHPLVFFRAHPDSFTINNTANQVSKGYQSAISFFLKDAYGDNVWMRYLSLQWMAVCKKSRSWVNPVKFIKTYEGTGSLNELWQLMLQSVSHILRRVSGRRLVFIRGNE